MIAGWIPIKWPQPLSQISFELLPLNTSRGQALNWTLNLTLFCLKLVQDNSRCEAFSTLGQPDVETRSSCMARNFKERCPVGGHGMAKYREGRHLIGILCKAGHISAAMLVSREVRMARHSIDWGVKPGMKEPQYRLLGEERPFVVCAEIFSLKSC